MKKHKREDETKRGNHRKVIVTFNKHGDGNNLKHAQGGSDKCSNEI